MAIKFPAVRCQRLERPSGLAIYHTGADLKAGPLPALIYLCGAGDQSLTLDPLNQPAAWLSHLPMRIFSFTLPCHGTENDDRHGIASWAQEFAQGQDVLTPFFDQAAETISELIEEEAIDPTRLAAAGLSRGAFAALHLAAREERIHTLLGFAPVTDLTYLESFKPLKDNKLVQELSLEHHLDTLATRSHRFYIGNRDMRVGTERCFALAWQLTETAFSKGIRSPPIEMIMTPSKGFKGHGTQAEIFVQGAEWVKESLGIAS